ncbi:MAG: nitrite and sulphite reductase 4Fe-4S region [Fibrobacteria bacterium]|jgi:sulfite reductase (ferredoxin)|nr:nitrite and sulphite reductase 4Fe-4S region [Fibrobacteria bacterium]
MTTTNKQELYTSDAAKYWKEALSDKLPAEWRVNVDEFESDIALKKRGKIEHKLFAETRLRMGAYGQRYDNGKRYDGKEVRRVPFPEEFKGPDTYWDAPGMERIKLPWGGLTADQMDLFADLAEEYSDGICHITTRQAIQLHYIHIENCPSMFRRLGALNITTREACGNAVRNVSADPRAGVNPDEAFDVTPYAQALFEFLLGHPDAQDFGRKFKIALSGDEAGASGLVNIHDLGLIATIKDGKRGFKYYVGGGLGAVPYAAKLFSDFVPEEEILPLAQAVCRIYGRFGEKKKRHRARIKFLIADMGWEKFRETVIAERAILPHDDRWSSYIKDIGKFEEKPLKPAGKKLAPTGDQEYDFWVSTNVSAQKQEGYSAVIVTLPLGDITSNQMRALADVARKYVKDTVRTVVEQNLILRWVSNDDIPAVYRELKKLGLALPGAESILDVTACPGTDTCKLGVSSSRGLAGELRARLYKKGPELHEAVRALRIKVSGCFNSCSHHHIADIGFYGISRNVGGYVVPHFQLMLGGQFENNGGAFGIGTGGVPSKAVPAVVERLTEQFVAQRNDGEKFRDWVERTGKATIMQGLQDLLEVPAYESDKSYYVDWGDVREYSVKDKGIGECAGEVVTLTDFGLKAADRELFDAQLKFEKDGPAGVAAAGTMAYRAMVLAAQGLLKEKHPYISEEPELVMETFTKDFHDTGIFHDPFAGPKFYQYYQQAHAHKGAGLDKEKVQHFLHEAQLFVEAAHSCYARASLAEPAEKAEG